jgi:hypothetical protein
MSIFKDSFHPSIRKQLETRQDAISNRTNSNLSYYNSRNAWIRLSSSVNTYSGPTPATAEQLKDPANYDNSLARQYVLQGGILKDYNKGQGALRSGLGDNGAYSGGYRLGIRPMPGITGVDIKSKGAYGSIRFATVTFQCWDIEQLENLELLYMRPGYTVLLEWGWVPYLDNNGAYMPSFTDYTDIIDTDWTKEELFAIQYAKSTDGKYKDPIENKEANRKGYEGNYDSMFGYIKNYSWKARMDGGYDCSLEIISIGEIVESLKVNYTPSDNISSIISTGLVTPNLSGGYGISNMNLSSSYSENILAGIFTEIYGVGLQMTGDENEGIYQVLQDSKHKTYYDIFRKKINLNSKQGDKDATSTGDIGNTDQQVYITLETLTHLLNNYVLLRDKKSSDKQKKSQPFSSVSVYEKDAFGTDPLTGTGYLIGLAHPVQISTDVSACLIKSPLWLAGGLQIQPTTPNNTQGQAAVKADDPNDLTKKYSNTDFNGLFNKFIELNADETFTDTDETQAVKAIVSYTKKNADEFREFQRQYLVIKDAINKGQTPPGVNARFIAWVKKEQFANVYSLMDAFLSGGEFTDIFGEDGNEFNKNATVYKPNDSKAKEEKAKIEEEKEKIKETNEKISESIENLKFLKNLARPYFVPPSAIGESGPAWSSELGIIGNIYVNISMLYSLCTNDQLAAQDKKEKNEIALYDFLKNVLARVSTAIGNVNNFDLFVDNDGVCRIIDVSYADRMKAEDAYENAFELQMHNTKSVVRSYNLESKIFQEQSTIVAIGAQAGGGALGTDTSTLVDFNKAIRDRIIPIKDAPTTPDQASIDQANKAKFDNLMASLSILATFFSDLDYYKVLGITFADSDFNIDEAGKYSNALKDLINFFKTFAKSKTKNKAILPTVLNVEMDGIGGIVIGNIFKIPPELLPKGYKSSGDGGIGPKLGYVVTGIGHSLQNNDWVTKVEAQTIILDEPQGYDLEYTDIQLSAGASTQQVTVVVGTGGAQVQTNTPQGSGGGTPPKGNTNTGGTTKVFNGKTYQNGKVDELLVRMDPALERRHRTSVCQSDGQKVRLQGKAMQKLEQMLKDAWKDGIHIGINSAYRTYDDQVRVKQQSAKSGIPAATPGRSNHGFGLAVDLGNSTGARVNPSKTPKEWKWIQANKYKYSFENINTTNESHHYNFYG